jgi:hypothetical protein
MAETFDPRRAEPDQRFVYNDFDGARIEAKADADGVLRPRNAAEERLADAFGLPVARKAITEDKAAATAKEGS